MTATRPPIEDVLALSPLQEGLFALYRLAGDGVDHYSMQFVVDVEGPLDVALLRRSAQAMLDRHPNLRAAFWDRDVDRPVQIVPAEAELPWTERFAIPTEFEDIARSERQRPFDLSRGPALRVVMLTVPSGSGCRMIFTAHHILMDGWALAVFFTEMLAVYRTGGSLDGLPTPRPYREYIVWLAEQDTKAALAMWIEYLREVSGPLMLADGATAGDGVPEKTELLLPPAETARLRRWAADNGLTLNTAVLFAWAVVLGRLTDRRDIVFGTIVSGRPQGLHGVETMVGLFINAVPVVHQLSDAAVVEQCARLQRESSAMRDIGYLSLSDIQREHGRGALFDTMFVFENAPIEDAVRPVEMPDGVRFCPVEMESLTHYPVTVVSHLRDDALVVLVEVIRQALPHLPAASIGERLIAVLRQLPDIGDEPPAVLDILNAAERAEYLDLPTRLSSSPRDDTIWELFERQVRASPDAVALTSGCGERFTYVELHAEAVRLAAELAEHGVGPERVVALMLGRSTRSVVAILAVLAAGGAYVPIDVDLPDARVASILRQSDPVLAITEVDWPLLPRPGLRTLVIDDPEVAERISHRAAVVPTVCRRPEHSAYVIFTSGSTGEPKGVIGTNAAVLNYFADHRERVYRTTLARIGRPLRIAHAWSLSFDASWQPMVGLLDGHALHLFDADEMRDADRLVRGLADYGVDMIDTTPSMYVQLCAAGLLDCAPAVLALGGEPIDTALWERLRTLPDIAVFNCYGPTETTVEAMVAPVGQYPAPTIGVPNTGTFGYVLDSQLRVVPSGVAGELYLSGAQLARGYAAGPALTAGRFVADPFRPGHRMYRTGDLVRRSWHGGYVYLGRGDSQVKIRGYRVEVGEIETALRGQPGVHDAAVVVRRGHGGATLIGFVVWQVNTEGDAAGLRAALTGRLPLYMVPARIVVVPRLPLNANGKLDRHALDQLAEEAFATAATGGGTKSASTDTERALCDVLAEQFNGVAPHVDDDFFSLGMDSIGAISLVNKARRRGVALSPRMVLTCSTIRQLAAAVDADSGAETTVRDAEHGEVPPLPIVSWLYEYGNYRRFTNSILLRLPSDIDQPSIEQMLQVLLDGHDTLRSIVADTPDGPRLITREPGAVRAADLFTHVALPGSTDAERCSATTYAARRLMDEIDPYAGAMMRAVWFSGADHTQALLLTVHHLAVDVVSWHIILSDLDEAWRAVKADAVPKTVPEFTSYRRWSELMWQRAAIPEVDSQRHYWIAQVREPDPALGVRHPDPTRDTWSTLRVATTATPVAVTGEVLAALTPDEGMREFLLAAMAATVASWRRDREQDPASGALIALDGHGRADAILDTDTSNTVGWFTSAFPVRLAVGGAAVDVEQAEGDPDTARALVDSVSTYLRAIPYEGLDYGLLRYVNGVTELRDAADPQIMFSYLGRLDLGGLTDQPWSVLTGPEFDALPVDPEPDLPLRFALYVSVHVRATREGSQLLTNWLWSDALFTPDDIDRLTRLWQRGIAALAAGLAP